ncbi:MAG TPA: hypothetical protein VMZ29_10955 [Candidatus Bathyarchaeia archaeon]|nr:hypothetical protein [Candidatus Bathyarchaeia archaeon]
MISEEEITQIILDFIRKETGYTKEATFNVGFDELTIKSKEEIDENTIKFTLKHFFEEDGFSQYPKFHELEGYVTLDKEVKIIDWYLEEVYTGPSSTLGLYKQNATKD